MVLKVGFHISGVEFSGCATRMLIYTYLNEI